MSNHKHHTKHSGKTLTFVIPINEFTPEQDLPLLVKALQSVDQNPYDNQVLIVSTSNTPDIQGLLGSYTTVVEAQEPQPFELKRTEIKYILNEGRPDYCSQVNFAAEQITTDYFAILGFDDEVSKAYVKNFHEYTTVFPNAPVLLPLTVEILMNDAFVKINNELAFNKQIGLDEVCQLNFKALMGTPSFQLIGGIISKGALEEYGGLKASMKFAFEYEFLLRVAYNEVIIPIIPKLLYVHRNGRPGSFFLQLAQSGFTEEETKFWVKNAQDERFYNFDRGLKFSV